MLDIMTHQLQYYIDRTFAMLLAMCCTVYSCGSAIATDKDVVFAFIDWKPLTLNDAAAVFAGVMGGLFWAVSIALKIHAHFSKRKMSTKKRGEQPHINQLLPTHLEKIDMDNFPAILPEQDPGAETTGAETTGAETANTTASQEKFGTGAIRDVLEALTDIRNIVVDVFSDNKVTITDLVVIPRVVVAATSLVKNLGHAWLEVKDLSTEEVFELKDQLFTLVLGRHLGA